MGKEHTPGSKAIPQCLKGRRVQNNTEELWLWSPAHSLPTAVKLLPLRHQGPDSWKVREATSSKLPPQRKCIWPSPTRDTSTKTVTTVPKGRQCFRFLSVWKKYQNTCKVSVEKATGSSRQGLQTVTVKMPQSDLAFAKGGRARERGRERTRFFPLSPAFACQPDKDHHTVQNDLRIKGQGPDT